MAYPNTEPGSNDTEPTLLGKILQLLNSIVTGSGIQVDLSSEAIDASGITESTVTVDGVDVAVLGTTANRAGYQIQNTGQQSCLISLANVAATTGEVLLPGGVTDWSNNQARYTGPIRARWNGTSTTLNVREIIGA